MYDKYLYIISSPKVKSSEQAIERVAERVSKGGYRIRQDIILFKR